jgi:Sec-independent protein translocase protein TatA
MFRAGPQAVVIIELLLLAVSGPGKLPSMVRAFGRFMSEARRYTDELKYEFVSGAEDETPERGEVEKKDARPGDELDG